MDHMSELVHVRHTQLLVVKKSIWSDERFIYIYIYIYLRHSCFHKEVTNATIFEEVKNANEELDTYSMNDLNEIYETDEYTCNISPQFTWHLTRYWSDKIFFLTLMDLSELIFQTEIKDLSRTSCWSLLYIQLDLSDAREESTTIKVQSNMTATCCRPGYDTLHWGAQRLARVVIPAYDTHGICESQVDRSTSLASNGR